MAAGVQPFRLDYTGFGDHVLRADWMVAEMHRRGEAVLKVAQATAPDAPPYGVGYKEEFHLTSGIRPGKKPRAYAEVYNTSPHAFFVEFGTEHNPRHRTLGKALGAGAV